MRRMRMLKIASISLTLWTVLAAAGLAQGFPNTNQTPGAILSGLNAPEQGRTAIIAYHNGILYTIPEIPSSQPGADFIVRAWDISDPTDPQVIETLGQTPMPINAHGYFKSGEYLIVGPNWPPEAPWTFQATNTFGVNNRTEFPGLFAAGVRGNLFDPWFVGQTYWSYDAVGGNASISRGGVEYANWDHLGETGVIGHPFLIGDLLIFASDQSRTGVATYDVSDLSNPVLLDVLTTGGAGGYWPEVWGGDGKLYIVFPYRTNGNGFRVVDATDPSNLEFVTDRPLSGDESMYIQFQDEFAFMGNHKVDMRTFESVLDLDSANVTRPNDGGTGVNTSQFLLPIGNLLVTGGIGPNEGMAIWAHQATPDTRGPSVGYHIPQAGRTNYPVDLPLSFLIHETLETATMVNGTSFIVRPLGGDPISGQLTFAFDDILTFTPDSDLADNTTYEVVFTDGGIEDAAGNGMVGYSFTFSTGGSVGGNSPPTINSLTASAYPVAPAANVTLTASATDTETIEYRFDFGDGSPRTAWAASNNTVHAYSDPGHYRVNVQARDTHGALSTLSTTVTVTTAPGGPLPTASSPIACDSTGRRVWAVHPDNDVVSAVNADTLNKEFETPVCDDPRSIARAGNGEIWVSCYDDDNIHVLNAGGSQVATINTGYGSAPAGLAISPDGNTAYVALQGRGSLQRYNTNTRAQTGEVALGPTPRAVAVSGDGGRVLVTRFISPRQQGEVWDVDTSSFNLTRTITIPKFGWDANRDTTASGRGIANYLVAVVISPDGNNAWVASAKTNNERGVFFAQDLDQDNSVRNIISRLDLNTGTFVEAIDLDNSESASALAFSPLGDYLFVALQGNDEIVVLDALVFDQVNGLGSLVTRLGSGRAPQGLCADATTGRVFVKDFMDRTVTALETATLFQTGNKTVASSAISTLATDTLTAQVLNGKQIFYNGGDPRMSAEGYLSCATCHLDGGSDHRVWDFTGRGEGFRNTTTLRGRGGTEQGNVHWSANFDEIHDFENDIRNAFGGSGLMNDVDFAATSDTLGTPKAGLSNDLDDLAAYVASLGIDTLPRSPYRNADGTMTAAGLAGETVFNDLNCMSCHSGTGLTDSTLGAETLHDVGTLRTTSGQRLGAALNGIDTPTILGVWNTPPYFHDGSAPTLEDVFVVAGGTVLQAESSSLTGGASLVNQYVDLNYDDTAHGQALVGMDAMGARMTFNNVDGGTGGDGALEIRYSAGYTTAQVEVRVNSVAITTANLVPTDNDPQWRHTYWDVIRLENIPLNAGAVNTIELTTLNSPNLSIDDILVTTATELTAAQPHRQVLALTQQEQDDLLAYLRQLDGAHAAGLTLLFADGFESGDTTSWSFP